jgi:hypothetical protein
MHEFGDLGRAHNVGGGERRTPGRENSTRPSVISSSSNCLLVLSAHGQRFSPRTAREPSLHLA